jgi:hypothetical protein
MKPVRAVVFVVGLALLAVGGYLPWYYANQHETFRVDFSPLFASEFSSPVGLFLKSISIVIWFGGFVLLRYLVHESPRKAPYLPSRQWDKKQPKVSCAPVDEGD